MRLREHKASLIACGCLLLAGYLLGRARAAEPAMPLLYSGLILEDGEPTSAGSAKLRVSLHAPGASDPVCEPTVALEAPLRAGRFELALHDDCVDAIINTPQLLVQLEVNEEALEARPLGTVPYALHARTADSAETLDGQSPGEFARIDHTHGEASAQGTSQAAGVAVASSLGYRLATVKVGGSLAGEACQAAQCTLRQTSGSVRSVERPEQGVYWVYFEEGTFAGDPTCACNALQGGSRDCTAVDPGRQAVMVHTVLHADGRGAVPSDLSFDLICVGPAAERE